MAAQCEFIEGCPIYKHFRLQAQHVFRELYCEGDFAACERRKLRLAGQPVPANLLPHGGTLWQEGEPPVRSG